MKLKKLSPNYIFIYILLLVVFLVGCTSSTINGTETQKVEPIVETAFLMGTITKISIYDDVDDAKEVEPIFKKVFDRIAEIEDRMTINKKTDKSEIIQLNNMAGKEDFKLSPDTFYVLEKGKYYSEISDGKYDITIGPIIKLWNIGMDEARLPKKIEIKNNLPLVNYKDLILDKGSNRAKLNAPGMIVDLGSIAKGYAADEAARILEEEGIKHAVVNLGGNIVATNKKPDNTHWRLGLQDPIEPRGEYMGIVMLDDQSLVTSGVYERFLELDGRNYHHILNTETGYPEENSLLSVSIITENSIDADALSTMIFLLGLEEGMKVIEDLPHAEAIFITSDKKVYQSSGIDEEIFKITKKEYQLQTLEVIK